MDAQPNIEEIKRIFGITEAQRNLIIWNTGIAFAHQFSQGEKMIKESHFWEVFKRLFTSDDMALLKHPEYHTIPYGELKECLSDNRDIKTLFCRLYYARKSPAANHKPTDLNLLRKRLIASIGGWLALSGKEGGLAVIKAIACRAAGKEGFNAIPAEQLRSLYNAFLQKQNAIKRVNEITQ